jgi:hypothetical protein
MSLKLCLAACLSCAVIVWGAGCYDSATPVSDPGTKKGDEHAHDHAAHGPHGGHIVEIGEEEYHAEWLHDEEGKVTVYLLDAEMKKEVPIPAEEITIETKVINTKAGEKTTTFKLPAVREADMTTTAKFEIVDKGLLGVLESLSEGVTATLKLDINGKAYEAPITHEEHKH